MLFLDKWKSLFLLIELVIVLFNIDLILLNDYIE